MGIWYSVISFTPFSAAYEEKNRNFRERKYKAAVRILEHNVPAGGHSQAFNRFAARECVCVHSRA